MVGVSRPFYLNWIIGTLQRKDSSFRVAPRKLFTADFTGKFDPTLNSPLVTSGFPSMRKPNGSSSCFSIAICLLLSLFFVLSTIEFYPSLHVFGLHDLVSRSFGSKGLDSESSTTTKLVVDPMSRMIVPESTAATKLTRSSQVQFDNYSLILRGQRIFL